MRPLRRVLVAAVLFSFVAFAGTLVPGVVFVVQECSEDSGSRGCLTGIILCSVAAALAIAMVVCTALALCLPDVGASGTPGADAVAASKVGNP
jgi:hypothetical protein